MDRENGLRCEMRWRRRALCVFVFGLGDGLGGARVFFVLVIVVCVWCVLLCGWDISLELHLGVA